jgi:sodium/bile acid cotransporter 7
MLAFFQRRWFLISLCTAIGVGMGLGAFAPGFVEDVIERLLNPHVRTGLVVAVLFLMSVTLNGERLARALVSPAPVLWAITVNAGLMPLVAPLLMPLQLSKDFAIGLLIAASVPSTLAAASVWTRRAGGNDGISLVVTMVTNSLCFVTTPYWLSRFAGASVELDPWGMMRRLLLTALLPIVVGQLVRFLPRCGAAADGHKVPLGVAAQIGVLTIIFEASCAAGTRFSSVTESTAPGLAALLVVAASSVLLHTLGLLVAYAGARLMRLPPADRIAVAFSASQKTLPIGVLIATDERMLGHLSWAVFPMLIFHTSQLFIDTAVADRFRSRTGGA